MSLVTKDFVIQGNQNKVWSLLNDPLELGKCVPGCEKVDVLSQTESRWKVKISMGVISRRIDAKAKVVEKQEPSKLKLQIQSVDGDMNGEWLVELQPQGESSTLMKFNATMKATGAFQWIFNQIIKNELDKMVNQFANCVSNRMTG